MKDTFDFLLTLPDDLYRVEINNFLDDYLDNIQHLHKRIDSWIESCTVSFSNYDKIAAKWNFYEVENFVKNTSKYLKRFSILEGNFSDFDNRLNALEDKFDNLQTLNNNLLSSILTLCYLLGDDKVRSNILNGCGDSLDVKTKAKNN